MAFWGVEVKPGKPYTHAYDQATASATARLRISQATLGALVGKAGKQEPKTTVQCNVGKKSPVLICSLFADKCETCHLELEFEEQEDVVFSVLGQRTVHLSGYYVANTDGVVEPYGEDIADTESDDSDYDEVSDEDEYESDFIDDSDDIEMYDGVGDAYCPSRSRKSGVIIEEILEEEVPANADKSRLSKKKNRQVSDSDDGAGDSQHQLAVVPASSAQVDSEDEDGFPLSDSKKTEEKHENKKRKIDDSSPIADEKAEEDNNGVAKKKKKLDKKSNKKEKGEKGSLSGVDAEDVAKEKAPIDSKKPGKSRDKLSKGDAAQEEKPVSEKMTETENGHAGDSVEKESKKKKKKKNKKSGEKDQGNKEEKDEEDKKKEPQQSRTFGNGLIVEEISMGRPDGKKATPGSKVSVNYIGKLKNGKIFDSNVGQRPFKFRLVIPDHVFGRLTHDITELLKTGVGQVIKGWDVGVSGMRVGDKRRLTIPPAMGYGDKAMGKIPKNSWLIFDVELVNVQ